MFVAEQNANRKLYQDNLSDEIKANNTQIKNILTNFKRYDMNYDNYTDLDDKYKTPEAKSILDDLGVEWGEDYQFRYKLSQDYDEQLSNNKNLIDVQRLAIEKMKQDYSNVTDLADEYAKVVDAGYVKGAIDYKDLMDHINKNPEMFAKLGLDAPMRTKEQGPIEDWQPGTQTGGNMFELNELAKAFLSKKQNIGGVDYGYLDQARVDSIVSDRAATDKDLKETEEEKWNDHMEYVFNDIKMQETQLGGKTADMLKKPGKGTGELRFLKGTDKLYASKDNRELLLEDIAQKIEGLMLWGDDKRGDKWWSAMSHMDSGTGTVKQLIYDMEGKEKSTRHALLRKLHDKVIPNEDMNQNLYGQGDSWKLEDMASIDLNTEGGANNTGEEEYLAS